MALSARSVGRAPFFGSMRPERRSAPTEYQAKSCLVPCGLWSLTRRRCGLDICAQHDPPSGFDQLMDKTIASALVDRLLHHAHVIVTEGESVRLIDATSGKGVVPLAS